ncbi:aminotransferase-like domain-containing protein [Aureimonas pseudogalii]|uniref:DNA-binding transcriptional MocR family regulator n=1 Tax=Aureimonas pseudogalii TaxID=1744844 RepID=A0A7W6H6P1_9HYPH|nr:PLP-dependent aminotransferase family protein [Aureimonas pseudogalii]MBB3999526.1 DNA-binding transcriptional MocR family regulator [Aureimonas pseudogalii]
MASSDKANPPATRTEALMEEIRRRMARRALGVGDRLPSVRAFAREMVVSPSTVVEAYARLVAEGLIRSRPGSGFTVAGPLPPLTLAEIEPRRERAIDPLWVSRQSLDAEAGVQRPGCGWLPADWMPHEAVRRALRTMARADDGLLADYGSTQGSPALRRLLARQFAAEGMDVAAGQILLTSSGTQALDLLCRLFLRAGDTVLVDDPCYFNFQALLRAHRVLVVGVPRTPQGPDLAAFAEAVAAHRPRLYVTNSAIHNPTGGTLSAQAAHRVLTIAGAGEMIVVEDDILADFEPEPSPRLAVLDGLDRVVRIGSFSKTLSASVRCGYVAGRRDWIEGLVDLQVATSFGSVGPLAAGVVETVLGEGGYRRHMAQLRQRLARQRKAAIAALAPLGIEPWTIPRGGFSLWCHLPEGCSSVELARAALERGIVLAPGNVFSASESADAMMRFNVAQMGDGVIEALGALLGPARLSRASG